MYRLPTVANVDNLRNRLVFLKQADRHLVFEGNGDEPVVELEGYLTKLGTESFVKRSHSRYCLLLADILLVTNDLKNGKMQVRQCVPLENVTVRDCEGSSDFMLMAPDYGRDFTFRTHSGRFEKDEWIFAIRKCCARLGFGQHSMHGCDREDSHRTYGWQHQLVTGTLYFYAIEGNLEELALLVDAYVSEVSELQALDPEEQDMPSWSLDTPDDTDGATMLHYAVNYGHPHIVEYLLNHPCGVDVNACDLSLCSPLHLAAATRRPALVKTLLRHGADYASRDVESDRTALFSSVAAACALTSDRDVDKQNGVASQGALGMIIQCCEALLKAGADPDDVDQSGNSVLMVAAMGKFSEIVGCLLAHGAAPLWRREQDGRTALHVACDRRLGSIVFPTIELLVDHGGTAALNALDNEGLTPLLVLLNSRACLNGSKEGAEVAKYLLAAGTIADELTHSISGGLFGKFKGRVVVKKKSVKDQSHKSVTPPHAPMRYTRQLNLSDIHTQSLENSSSNPRFPLTHPEIGRNGIRSLNIQVPETIMSSESEGLKKEKLPGLCVDVSSPTSLA